MVLAAQRQNVTWEFRKELLNSFPRYAESCLKIQTVDGDLAPFEFNEVQNLLELIFQDMRDKGRLVRAIILKARREGASTYITTDPTGPFAKFTVLPMQIYQWTSRPQAEFRNIAAAAILVLLVLLLALNATAILLRNRYSKRL
jgi:hypothetical protein